MMSEWQQQGAPSAAPPPPPAQVAPLPQGARVEGVPDGHGVGGSASSGRLQIDLYHFVRTIPGMLKLVELVFGITCIALAAPALHAGTHWFLFVTVTSMLVTLLWIVVYLFTVKDAINIPWITIEFLCLAVISLLYFIAFIVQLSIWGPAGKVDIDYSVKYYINVNIAAGCFGLFNFLVYAGHTFLAFVDWRTQPTARSA